MSENENEDMSPKLEAMNKKLSSMNKILKNLLEKLEQKLCGANETVDTRGHGKPRGTTFEEKQQSYLDMLNNRRIREPKPQTLEFYHIQFDKDKNMYYGM